MSYKKVYYKEIWDIDGAIASLTKEWAGNIEKLSSDISELVSMDYFKGEGADNIKCYLSETPILINQSLNLLLEAYVSLVKEYYAGYKSSVDSGGKGKGDSGPWYTTLVFDELHSAGSVPIRINKYAQKADYIMNEANSIARSISDLADIGRINNSDLLGKLKLASRIATQINEKVLSYEASKQNDMADIDRLIAQIRNIISYQTSSSRISVTKYTTGAFLGMCDIGELSQAISGCNKRIEDYQNSDLFEEAENLAYNHDAIIKAEEQNQRKWVKWVAVGVAIVGSIAVTVVTAGTAGPIAAAAVGAIVGGVTTATENLANEYVENGNLNEMDWTKFGRNVTVGAVTGAIGGYFGALKGVGSAIKAPIKTAWQSARVELYKGVAELTTNKIFDVGEAVIANYKDGNVISALKDAATINSHDYDIIKNTFVKTGGQFVGGFVNANSNFDHVSKNFGAKFLDNTKENIAKEMTSGFMNTGFEMSGVALGFDKENRSYAQVIQDNLSKTGGKIVEGEIDFLGSTLGDKIQLKPDKSGNISAYKKIGNVVINTFSQTTTDTTKTVASGATKQIIDHISGRSESDKLVDFNEIYEKDLDGGRKIIESAATKLKDNVVSTIQESHKDEMYFKKNADKSGRLDVVTFNEEYNSNSSSMHREGVLRQDYDSVMELTDYGTKEYKGKTAQEMLGLAHDVDIHDVSNYSVSADDLEKSHVKNIRSNATSVYLKEKK